MGKMKLLHVGFNPDLIQIERLTRGMMRDIPQLMEWKDEFGAQFTDGAGHVKNFDGSPLKKPYLTLFKSDAGEKWNAAWIAAKELEKLES